MTRITVVANATRACISLLLTGLLIGCSSLKSGFDVSRLRDEARKRGFETFESGYPGLILTKRASLGSGALWIFLEGDGAPFGGALSQTKTDPTPVKSVALRLALLHQSGDRAYLSRPCQYVQHQASVHCEDESLWQARRFGTEALDLVSGGFDDLLATTSRDVVLVGHSGGGVLALGLAARRPDRVRCVVTLASPLNLAEWAQHHQIRGLEIAVEDSLRTLPRTIHFRAIFGDADAVIGAKLTTSWIKRSEKNNLPQAVIELIAATHTHGWMNFWETNQNRLCSAEKTLNYSIRHEDDRSITPLYPGSIAGTPLE